jgi:hypothetical protein
VTREQIISAVAYVRRIHPGAVAYGRYIYPSGKRDGRAIPVRLVLPIMAEDTNHYQHTKH